MVSALFAAFGFLCFVAFLGVVFIDAVFIR